MAHSDIFPVGSATACLLKWGWSTLLLYTGQTNSCHRTTLSSFTSESVDSFHNTADKISQRALMRDGEWPARGNGCEYCRDIEDAGGMSDRTTNLALLQTSPSQRELIPVELLDDPDAIEVTPTMLEVYFTNHCNMSCVYCSPNYSTRWVAENARYGQPDHHGSTVDADRAVALDADYPAKLRNFWAWMERHHRSLRMFNVLGGEPFLQDETEQTIRFWAGHPNPDVDLKIFSNLKVEKRRFEYLLAELKRLLDAKCCRSVGICPSLDCWGPEQEYVRTGLDLESWQENYESLIFEHPWALVSVNSTINALSLRTMAPLLRRMQAWKAERARRTRDLDVPDISLVFNMLLGPEFMHAGIFPAGFFRDELEEIVDLLPADSDWERANVEYMRGIGRSIDAAPHSPALIERLKGFLDEMDRRRGTDWRQVFPWLIEVR